MFKGASELTTEVTLPEADVMRFVRLDKPAGFIGDELTRLSAASNRRPWQCVYLEVDAKDADCLGGEAILANGTRVGAVSSGAWGPTINKSLAFGYIPPALAIEGTTLEVMILGEPRLAYVRTNALYDPDNVRPRGE
jgi:dimethylglycine dehydrogenase